MLFLLLGNVFITREFWEFKEFREFKEKRNNFQFSQMRVSEGRGHLWTMQSESILDKILFCQFSIIFIIFIAKMGILSNQKT